MTNDELNFGGSTKERPVVAAAALAVGCLIAGAAFAVGYVIATGMLAVEVMETKAGLEIPFQNDGVLSVETPHVAWVQIMAIAWMSALAYLAVAVVPRYLLGSRRSQVLATVTRIAILAGFGLGLGVLIIRAFGIVRNPAAGQGMRFPLGIAHGTDGWIQQGGQNPAVHVVAVLTLLALLSIVATMWRRRSEGSID